MPLFEKYSSSSNEWNKKNRSSTDIDSFFIFSSFLSSKTKGKGEIESSEVNIGEETPEHAGTA